VKFKCTQDGVNNQINAVKKLSNTKLSNKFISKIKFYYHTAFNNSQKRIQFHSR